MANKHFCSLDWSRKLIDAGVKNISLFKWVPNNDDKSPEELKVIQDKTKHLAPAFSVPELDIMLGNRWERPRLPKMTELAYNSKMELHTNNLAYSVFLPTKQMTFDCMANAYAFLIVTLISDNLLDADEVNIRLTKCFPDLL